MLHPVPPARILRPANHLFFQRSLSGDNQVPAFFRQIIERFKQQINAMAAGQSPGVKKTHFPV